MEQRKENRRIKRLIKKPKVEEVRKKDEYMENLRRVWKEDEKERISENRKREKKAEKKGKKDSAVTVRTLYRVPATFIPSALTDPLQTTVGLMARLISG